MPSQPSQVPFASPLEWVGLTVMVASLAVFGTSEIPRWLLLLQGIAFGSLLGQIFGRYQRKARQERP